MNRLKFRTCVRARVCITMKEFCLYFTKNYCLPEIVK